MTKLGLALSDKVIRNLAKNAGEGTGAAEKHRQSSPPPPREETIATIPSM